VIPAAICYSI